MDSRRQFLEGSLALAGFCLLSGCERFDQQATKVRRIGFLAVGSREGRAFLIDGFLQGLREHGYVEGKNIAIDPLTTNRPQVIADLARKHRLPTISDYGGLSRAGGLLSYGPDLADSYRRAAVFVDKILKGANPGELPMEQPTKFDMVVNQKTARFLGLTIPQSVLVQATQVIE